MFRFFFELNFVACYTLVLREFFRVIRIWPQTILPPVITVVLYFFVFGKIIGLKIGYMCGYKYIQYIIPGLIMMSIITSAYANVSSSFFSAKFQRYLEELFVAPVESSVIIFGFIFGGVIRSFFILSILYIILYFFCDYYFYNYFLIFISFLFTSLFFSLLGFINAIFSKKFDDISVLPTFILTPMIYFSGVFFSIDLLPSFLNYFVYFNPIFYIVNLFRYSFLGISDINIYMSIFFLIFLIFILYFLCEYLFYTGFYLKK